jgi:hypothetical protein
LLLALLAAAPLLPIAVSQAQPAAAEPGNDMAPSPDDDEEGGGNDTAQRQERPAPSAAPSRLSTGGACAGPTALAPMRMRAAAANPPHPLQLADPDHDVVVCEAGCDGPAGAIVFLLKRKPGQVE